MFTGLSQQRNLKERKHHIMSPSLRKSMTKLWSETSSVVGLGLGWMLGLISSNIRRSTLGFQSWRMEALLQKYCGTSKTEVSYKIVFEGDNLTWQFISSFPWLTFYTASWKIIAPAPTTCTHTPGSFPNTSLTKFDMLLLLFKLVIMLRASHLKLIL